jgi:uncharacterized protein YndB with AHSA1/START domain
MTDDRSLVLRIERTYDAPAEEVFDAWTSEEVMRRWFHAGSDWETPEAEVDLRVGGTVRIVMRSSDGSEVSMGGEYTVIDRPRRLEFTWTFSDDPANQQQLIEIEFSEQDGVTTVLFVNSNIAGDERHEAQQNGWQLCFDNLDRVLAA